jgi:glutathione S-transferase
VGPERALLPARGPVRQEGMRISALGSGLADKAVSLFYEPLLRDSPSRVWVERCHTQIRDTLDRLEADRAGRATDYWLGDSLSHADVACALRFTDEAHPGLFAPKRWPHLAAHSRRCEALPEFVAISQPILVNLDEGAGARPGETGGA